MNADVAEDSRRQRIGTLAYDAIEQDLYGVGASLWPSPPVSMSDAAFCFWWKRDPAKVLYYPHRARLGLSLTASQARALDELEDIDRMLAKIRHASESKSLWPKLRTAAELWLRKK